VRRFLDKHNIPYTWIDIDRDHEAEKFVLNANGGMRSVPTIIFEDGSKLVEPSTEALAKKIGLSHVR
jgi:glutaredoxin